MRTFFTLLTVCLLTSLGACRYAPQDYVESRPELEDSVRDLDIYVYGEGAVNYFVNVGSSDDPDYQLECQVLVDVVGWFDEEFDGSGCSRCSEIINLGFTRTDESTCDFGIESTPAVGIASLDTLDPDSWFYEWVQGTEPEGAAGPAIGYLSTNWNPAGYADWSPRMGLWEKEDTTGIDF
ncbi:MAG TPA: hypothetical protein DIU15_13540, partial [Deltaproteobacteria bacterium]|nr:hypothetical protein [Deltaproteobacteria bacterium]